MISRSIRLGEAPRFGKGIIGYAPSCSCTIAYRELAQEFLSRQHGDVRVVP